MTSEGSTWSRAFLVRRSPQGEGGRPGGVPSAAGAWTALFPVTYAVHIAEEYWAGDTFSGWVSRLWSIDFSQQEFLVLNAIAMAVMIAGVIVANVTTFRLPIAALGFIVAFNGALHAVASVVTASYSPGVVSGVLIWIPFGVFALRRAYGALPRRQFYGGIVAGLIGHALMSLLAFSSSPPTA